MYSEMLSHTVPDLKDFTIYDLSGILHVSLTIKIIQTTKA